MNLPPIPEPVVLCAATLDTKGHEASHLCHLLKQWGIPTLLVDVSAQKAPQVPPDISSTEVLSCLDRPISHADLAALSRSEAVAVMAQALKSLT